MLRRLDILLARSVEAADRVFGEHVAKDPYRGLYISPEDAVKLSERSPGMPLLHLHAKPSPPEDPEWDAASRLCWIRDVFALSMFEVDVLLIALAPEVDLKYERLFAYLQDDVTRKRPTVDLILNLLCESPADKLRCRNYFGANAPLLDNLLLHLFPDPNHAQPPLLSHYARVDEQIIGYLLGEDSLDRRLVPFCQLLRGMQAEDLLAIHPSAEACVALARQARSNGRPLRLYFEGAQEAAKRHLARVMADRVGAAVLMGDLSRLAASENGAESQVRLLFREARLHEAILYLEGVDALYGEDRVQLRTCVLQSLSNDPGITVLSGVQPWRVGSSAVVGAATIRFDMPAPAERKHCWETSATAAGMELPVGAADILAARFRLFPEQIAEAVAVAVSHADYRAARSSTEGAASPADRLSFGDLSFAARAQCGHDLAKLAHKIEPCYTWDDIVLPADSLAQLLEICQRITYRSQVMDEWGFGRKLSLGKGVTALFAGSSGTGKTMAAEIIANELSLDLYKIDLSGVISKYIGETEKNLDQVFTAAENSNAIIFFDEADALFGKRSEVQDAHDRYANVETAYLLQKMEEFEGITILATNLRANMDSAFVRRIEVSVSFPFPEESERLRIWQQIWPPQTPRALDLDLDFMARQFRLSGGNIKNIALAASFLGAAEGESVGMGQLMRATKREFQKMGKTIVERDFGRYAGLVELPVERRARTEHQELTDVLRSPRQADGTYPGENGAGTGSPWPMSSTVTAS